MKAPEFKIIEHGGKEWSEAVRLREDILRTPLGSTFSEEELFQEAKHVHVIGVLNDQIVATAVLVPEDDAMKMQRVVVAQSLRNGNIGSAMMEFCEHYCTDQGFPSVYCHARDSAVNFYDRNGYFREGDYFDEDGIPHLKMRKELSTAT